MDEASLELTLTIPTSVMRRQIPSGIEDSVGETTGSGRIHSGMMMSYSQFQVKWAVFCQVGFALNEFSECFTSCVSGFPSKVELRDEGYNRRAGEGNKVPHHGSRLSYECVPPDRNTCWWWKDLRRSRSVFLAGIFVDYLFCEVVPKMLDLQRQTTVLQIKASILDNWGLTISCYGIPAIATL